MLQTVLSGAGLYRNPSIRREDLSNRSFKSKDAPSPVHPSVKSKTGWWSGALSSRDSDTEKYYPLFCRIEIKAKVPYLYGLLECTLVEAL